MMKEKTKKYNMARVFPILMGAAVLSGIVGFIYETIFYWFNNGAYTRRGNMFGPWLLIYAVGGILLMLSSYRLYQKKRPFLVFVVCGLVATTLEFVSGYCQYHFNGVRLWDYSTEILNFGNIGGFVCFRSFWSFGLLGILLMYVIYPFLKWLRGKLRDKKFFVLMLILVAVFVIDLVYNTVLYKYLGTISAPEFYHNTGWYGIVSEYAG